MSIYTNHTVASLEYHGRWVGLGGNRSWWCWNVLWVAKVSDLDDGWGPGSRCVAGDAKPTTVQVAGHGTEALEMSRCVRGCVSYTLCRLTCAQLLTINNTCKGDGVLTFLMPCSFQEDSFLANFINDAVADHIHSYRRFTGACEIAITFCRHQQTLHSLIRSCLASAPLPV